MSDVRALLLTDVVDSTALTERLGDAAMAELWARHDRVARDLLVQHNGREIDKTDGFLLLFDVAADAVAYAVAFHRAMGELGIKARAGLHVGPVTLRENAADDVARGAKPLEVEGIGKTTAGRVMSIAQGEQTLVTAETAAALPEGAHRVESHGHWRMRGVAEPVELLEVGETGARFEPPPDTAKAWRVVWRDQTWQPVREMPHSLPQERNTFVGRTEDLQDIARRLDDGTRLLSVIGIGGTGKTRLVTHYGWSWLGAWPGGVWFCDLAEARNLSGIVSAVARALDVPLGTGDPVVQLGHAIGARGTCLVVLDNFEQVAPLARDTLGRWLDRADKAQFVVTSREVLGLRGERTKILAPLDTVEGAALFAARGDTARSGWSPTDAERVTITSLVTLLDGLPLAIELAAARVPAMSVEEIRARMADRFRLLAASEGRHDRRATLRAAIDWSWDLLSPWEKAGLAQCSAFEGGFSLVSAEAVLDLVAWPDAPWPMDVVQALVDKSLVRQVTDERFGLLVSIHEYAAEKLRTSGSYPGSGPDAERAAWALHGAHFAEHGADEALDELYIQWGPGRFQVLSAELDNLAVGCRRACVQGDGAIATALLRAAWEVLQMQGPFLTGVALAEAVQVVVALDVAHRAHAARIEGRARSLAGQPAQAEARLEMAVVHYREASDKAGEAQALCALGGMFARQGRMDEAQARLELALVLARQLGACRLETLARRELASVPFRRGQHDEARAHTEAALAIAQQIGDRRSEGMAYVTLGAISYVQGVLDQARRMWGAALTVSHELGDRRGEGNNLGNLGEIDLVEGRLDEAWTHTEAAIKLLREVGERGGEGYFLANLGQLHLRAGRLAEGRDALAASEAILRETQKVYLLAMVLGHRAALECDAGDRAAAGTFLAQSEGIIQQMGAGADSEPGRIVARVKARLAELGA